MDIRYIVDAIKARRVKITDHADEEAANDGLNYSEIYHSTLQGEIIEEYPDDGPYPSCLIFGRNSLLEPIHSVWAYNAASGWAVLITVYRPDPERWIDWKKRVQK